MGQHTSQRNAFESSFELAYVIAMNKDNNKNNSSDNNYYFSAPYCNRCEDKLSEIFPSYWWLLFGVLAGTNMSWSIVKDELNPSSI